jgi:hypothetical protein
MSSVPQWSVVQSLSNSQAAPAETTTHVPVVQTPEVQSSLVMHVPPTREAWQVLSSKHRLVVQSSLNSHVPPTPTTAHVPETQFPDEQSSLVTQEPPTREAWQVLSLKHRLVVQSLLNSQVAPTPTATHAPDTHLPEVQSPFDPQGLPTRES